jgi:hypothetical protein
VTPAVLVQLRRRRQYLRRQRRLGRRPPPRRPSAVRTRRFPCGRQCTRPTAAAGAVEAVTFETASGAPWTWSCASCPPGGCAITARSNGTASSASTPPMLVGTVPAALGDLWCIGKITRMCVRSGRAVASCAAHRKCGFLQGPERAKPHRPVARHHHAAAPTLVDVRARRLAVGAARPA